MKRNIFKELLRRPLGVTALAILLTMYTCAFFADFIAPYDYGKQDLTKTFHPPTAIFWKDGNLHAKDYTLTDASCAKYEPTAEVSHPLRFFNSGKLFSIDDKEARVYLLGSDSTGRDIFSRLLYGARISLSIGLIGITITMLMGFTVGSLSGYLGGRFDFCAMRIVEFLMAIPGLYLLLSLRSALAQHFDSTQMFLLIVIILAFIGWAGSARIIRGMTLSIRNRQFVLASESMGQPTLKILFKHVLPNLSSYLLVAATLSVPGYILGEAALSFLGLGIQEPSASWGLMLSQAQNMKIFMLDFWWMLTPGFFIFITVISFNVLGDVLRDIVDPKMKV